MAKSLRRTIVALVIACVTSPAVSAKDCKPVVGHFEAVAVPPGEGHCPSTAPLCTAGRVWGGIQGEYQFVVSGVLPSASIGGVPTIIFFTGRSTVFLKNGEQIVGTDTGSLDLPPGQGGFASLITFENGQIRLRGELDSEEGVTSGDYIGTLCK